MSKCPKCDAVFNNVDNLTVSLHLFRHYAGQLINMVKFGEDNFCEECGMTLASRQSFFLHSAIAHNQVQISRKGRKGFKITVGRMGKGWEGFFVIKTNVWCKECSKFLLVASQNRGEVSNIA